MSTTSSKLFTNHLNSPFSEPQSDRSENVGLEAILAHVAQLRRPNLPERVTLIGGLFGDLADSESGRYEEKRRDEMLEHYEAYLSRVRIFEEVIRAEALVRYLVKSPMISSLPASPQLKKVAEERGGLLSGMLDLLDWMAAAEEQRSVGKAQTNAKIVRRLIAMADVSFFDPLENFRNRIAHGYSRAFHSGLRRNGLPAGSDVTASELFNRADVISATCVVDNLQSLSLLIYTLPFSYAKFGTLSSPMILEDAALRRSMPTIRRPHWESTFVQDVNGMPSALQSMITFPAQALRAFWQAIQT